MTIPEGRWLPEENMGISKMRTKGIHERHSDGQRRTLVFLKELGHTPWALTYQVVLGWGAFSLTKGIGVTLGLPRVVFLYGHFG